MTATNFNATSAWSQLDTVVEQWNLTPEEEGQMRDLQQRLLDVNHWKNDPFEIVRLLRFYRHNVDVVEASLRRIVDWRINQRMDSFLDCYSPDPLFDHYPSVMLKGVDKEGDPILVERIGKADLPAFHKNFGSEGILEFIKYSRERIMSRNGTNWQEEHYEPTHGRRVKQMTVVADLEGLSRAHFKGSILQAFACIARLSQDYYAGMAKRFIVVRAPAVFKMCWSLIKHFLDPATRELLVFTNKHDYLHVLDKYIDREVLPPEICPLFGKGEVLPQYSHVNLAGGALASLEKERGMDEFTLTTSSLDETTDEEREEDEEQNVNERPSSNVIGVVLAKGFRRFTVHGTEEVCIEV